MRKTLVIVAVLAGLGLLVVVGGVIAGMVWRSRGPSASDYRVELTYVMAKNGEPPTEAEAKTTVEVLRARLPRNVSVKPEGADRVVITIGIPKPNVPAKATPQEAQELWREQARKTGQGIKLSIETPGTLDLHHVFAVDAPPEKGGYTHDKEISDKLWRGEKVPGFMVKKYVHDRGARRRGRKNVQEMLALREKPVVSGAELDKAQVRRGDAGLEIMVDLTAAGGRKMRDFTDPRNKEFNIRHNRDRLAILFDGVVNSAPSIQSTLGARFRITGRFTREEADRICRILNSGTIPCKLLLVSQKLLKPGE